MYRIGTYGPRDPQFVAAKPQPQVLAAAAAFDSELAHGVNAAEAYSHTILREFPNTPALRADAILRTSSHDALSTLAADREARQHAGPIIGLTADAHIDQQTLLKITEQMDALPGPATRLLAFRRMLSVPNLTPSTLRALVHVIEKLPTEQRSELFSSILKRTPVDASAKHAMNESIAAVTEAAPQPLSGSYLRSIETAQTAFANRRPIDLEVHSALVGQIEHLPAHERSSAFQQLVNHTPMKRTAYVDLAKTVAKIPWENHERLGSAQHIISDVSKQFQIRPGEPFLHNIYTAQKEFEVAAPPFGGRSSSAPLGFDKVLNEHLAGPLREAQLAREQWRDDNHPQALMTQLIAAARARDEAHNLNRSPSLGRPPRPAAQAPDLRSTSMQARLANSPSLRRIVGFRTRNNSAPELQNLGVTASI